MTDPPIKKLKRLVDSWYSAYPDLLFTVPQLKTRPGQGASATSMSEHHTQVLHRVFSYHESVNKFEQNPLHTPPTFVETIAHGGMMRPSSQV